MQSSDAAIKISFFKSDRDSKPKLHEVTWEKLVEMLSTFKTCPCTTETCIGYTKGDKCEHKATSAWSAGIFDGEGKDRTHLLNSSRILIYDIDKQDFPIVKAAIDRLETAGLKFVVSSTHSHHAPAKVCLRVVVLLNRELSLEEFPRVYAAVRDTFDLPCDPQCKDATRIYYIPSHPTGAKTFAAEFKGEELDVDAFLKTYTPPKPPSPTAAQSALLDELTSAPAPQSDEPRTYNLDEMRKKFEKWQKGKLGVWKERVLKGEPLEQKGNRDIAIYKVAQTLQYATQCWDIEPLLEIMRPSLEAMSPPEKHEPTWLEMGRLKLKRVLAEHQLEQEKKEADAQLFDVAKRQKTADPITGESDEYTNEQLEQWADARGITRAQSKTRWIIYHKGANYVFANGKYKAPMTHLDFESAVYSDLARVPKREITLEKWDNKNGLVPIGASAVLREYGTQARFCKGTMLDVESAYDAKAETFIEAKTHRIKFEPVFHKHVDKWLTLMGGKHSQRFLDWLATFDRLEKPTCAIYFMGPPGIGKTLLPSGLARLYGRDKPTMMEDVVGKEFNAEIADCPLIFADEHLPPVKGIMAELRNLIARVHYSANNKFLPKQDVEGAVRVLISANNERVLKVDEELSTEDIEAIVQRILYIELTTAPGDFLRELQDTDPHVTERMAHYEISEHVTWLSQNRQVIPGKRFLVESVADDFHLDIVMNTPLAGHLLQFMVSWLNETPEPAKSERFIYGDGEILATPDFFIESQKWEKQVGYHRQSLTRVAEALRRISNSVVELHGRSYFRLSLAIVRRYQSKTLLGSKETFEKRIAGKKK